MMMNNLWTRLEFVLSISAIAAAGLFAILCIIFIVIVIVKLKGTLPYIDVKKRFLTFFKRFFIFSKRFIFKKKR